jgi:single-stranded DNA-binding protein
MALHTQESVSGFIASDPQLTYTERGDARLYVKIGQEHYRKEPDGSFTQTETTFHDLVAFKKTAERAYERFAKGDKFVAEGYTREYDRQTPDGETVKAEEFVAKKLGHDLARTTYEVDRTRRSQAAPVQEAAEQAPAGLAPRRETASATPSLGL